MKSNSAPFLQDLVELGQLAEAEVLGRLLSLVVDVEAERVAAGQPLWGGGIVMPFINIFYNTFYHYKVLSLCYGSGIINDNNIIIMAAGQPLWAGGIIIIIK